MEEVKSGTQSTEFWITLIPYLLLVIKNVTGMEFQADVIINGILGLITVITTVTYIIGRVKLKSEAMKLNSAKGISTVSK